MSKKEQETKETVNETETKAVVKKDVQIVEKASVQTVLEQVNIIQELYAKAMKEGVDYGVIPGCGKPSLLKAGAEKITFMFRLRPNFIVDKEWLPNGHLVVNCKCELLNQNGEKLGEGVGMCSTLEKKYRWRDANRKCPVCGKETIFKDKKEGGGWYCWTKKGGCGKQFAENDSAILNQIVGKVENPDIADEYNTVLKMAKKRAYIDATLTVSGVSDLFTQDLDEKIEHNNGETKETQQEQEQQTQYKEWNILYDKAKSLLHKITENLTDEEKVKTYYDILERLELPKDRLNNLEKEHLQKLVTSLEKTTNMSPAEMQQVKAANRLNDLKRLEKLLDTAYKLSCKVYNFDTSMDDYIKYILMKIGLKDKKNHIELTHEEIINAIVFVKKEIDRYTEELAQKEGENE